MYTTQQQRGFVLQIQTALALLSNEHFDIPSVLPDGIYGPETTESVKVFQRIYGLPVTGAVDYFTWTALLEEGGKIAAQKAPPYLLNAFPSANLVIKPGDSGGILYILQAVLNALASFDFPPVPYTGYYDQATQEAIIRFQQRVQLPQTGQVDCFTWNNLARHYNAQQRL